MQPAQPRGPIAPDDRHRFITLMVFWQPGYEGLPVFTASLLRVVLGALSLFPFVAADLPTRIRSLSARDCSYLSVIALFGIIGSIVLLI